MALYLHFYLLLVFIKVDASYLKISKMDLPWLNGPRIGNCGDDKPKPCNISYLESQCDLNPKCNGFNSNGFLKMCNGGQCGCQLSSDSCPGFSNNQTELYIKRGTDPPNEWKNGILNAEVLYDASVNDTNTIQAICYEPEIGNGYLATNVNWDAMYISGLFNGKCGSVHKARIPSTMLVTLSNATLIANGLNLRNAVFEKRWKLNDKNTIISQRFMAHRKYRHILFMELEIVNSSTNGNIEIYLQDKLNLNPSNLSALPGNGCAGGFTNDFKFEIISIDQPMFMQEIQQELMMMEIFLGLLLLRM